MVRLYLFAEGQTEQTFASIILQPHLAQNQVFMHKPRLIAHGRKKGFENINKFINEKCRKQKLKYCKWLDFIQNARTEIKKQSNELQKLALPEWL